ncbi:MAG TPA: GNAT family N-acetyltransferase [Candidatus Omnitrophota bacterium]|nr:GNAT family N-acetyltransferase [Candidatus Omnitrophota bacterium]
MTVFCSAQEFESLCRDLCGKAAILRLQAKGGSMHPFIRSGDWVQVDLSCRGAETIRAGDVILFRQGDGLFAHRVLRSMAGGFLVKGDMSFGADGVAVPDDVLGRVIAVERGSRRIDLRSRKYRIVSVFVAAYSMAMQYPWVAARKFAGAGMVVLSLAQSLKAYRRVLRTLCGENFAVRDAGPEDEEQLRDLYLMASHDIRDSLYRVKKEGTWLVAEEKGRIIAGLTMTRYEKDHGLWLIFGLEVKLWSRGRGAGSLLVKEAIARAKASGGRAIGLFVNKKARPACMLYRQLGFKEQEAVPGGFNCSIDDLYLTYRFNCTR